MLVSHFILSLRGLGTGQNAQNPSANDITTVAFRVPDSIVGNLGESLAGLGEEGVDDEESIEVAEILGDTTIVASAGLRTRVHEEDEGTV